MSATMTEAMTMDTFWAKYHKRALVLFLVGEGRGIEMLRAARMVWEQFPAQFPEVASIVLDCEDVRAAAWDIMQIMSEVPGGHDIWRTMRGIAEA